ncbi:hypothetical protein EJB05_36627 [Eragrostis curvula]|uniref:Uncharacterized protein n=1 Tax=Eragrostis curvula TaxID=38414 RepID=A0A5J9U9L4_9POAL|nr:hypothetical protein EJB05_36627 [Eragrostis curvula]
MRGRLLSYRPRPLCCRVQPTVTLVALCEVHRALSDHGAGAVASGGSAPPSRAAALTRAKPQHLWMLHPHQQIKKIATIPLSLLANFPDATMNADHTLTPTARPRYNQTSLQPTRARRSARIGLVMNHGASGSSSPMSRNKHPFSNHGSPRSPSSGSRKRGC